MKFVCEKCNTKYSIADAKVRRKVLKIRCKNCSSIIVVRDAGTGLDGTDPDRAAPPPGRALDRAFDGAFTKTGSRPRRITSGSSPLRLSPAAAVGSSPELEEDFPAEETRLSTVPDFVEPPVAAPSGEDEWYLAVDGNQFGPMGLSELCSRVKRGETGSEAFVWRDGFDDWLEINEVAELKPFVPRHPPPPPKSRSGLFPMAAAIPAPVTSRPPAPPVPPLPSAGGAFASLPPSIPAPPRVAASYAPPPAASLPPPEPFFPPLSATPAQASPMVAALEPSGASLLPPPPAPATQPLPVDTFAPPLPAPVLTPAPPPGKSATPLLLKVTAAAGIASVLLGGALVVYFLFIDRPPRDARPVAQLVPTTDPQPAALPAASARPDAGSQVSIEFQPVEVERGPKPAGGRRVAVAAKPAKGKEAAPAAGPTLSEKERALMELYKKGGEKGAPPAASAEPRGPNRVITGADIANVQRKNATMMKACYERALKRDDTLAEVKANVTVTINDHGQVTQVKIDGIDNVQLVTCLRTSIGHWRFDPIGEQTFRFPVVFRGS
jgi:predicted Zn finger-like uncharacterized protein